MKTMIDFNAMIFREQDDQTFHLNIENSRFVESPHIQQSNIFCRHLDVWN